MTEKHTFYETITKSGYLIVETFFHKHINLDSLTFKKMFFFSKVKPVLSKKYSRVCEVH